MTPRVSIVIPFYRDNTLISHCLSSIERAWAFLPFNPPLPEIIIVDDHSPTPFDPGDYKLPVHCHRFVTNRGVGAARNMGARLSRGTHLLFLDSDVRLDDRFFIRLYPHLEKGRGPIIQGPTSMIPANHRPSLFHHYMALSWHYYQVRNWSISVFTQCVVIEREFFFRLGGFSERYARSGGEEFELGFRLARTAPSSIVFDPELIHSHYSDGLSKRLKKVYLRSRYIRRIALSMPNLPFRFTAQSLLRSCFAFILNLALIVSLVYPIPGFSLLILFVGLFYLCDDSFSRHMRNNHSWGLSVMSVFFRQLEYSFINLGMLSVLITGDTHDQ